MERIIDSHANEENDLASGRPEKAKELSALLEAEQLKEQDAKLTDPRTMHGSSLTPLLKGENPALWRDAIYYHYQMIV